MEVFVGEQRVPAEEEMDDLDAVSIHVIALVDGSPQGTGRLIPGSDATAKIGRMAVRESYRGQGVGSAILTRLTELARERGIGKVSLASQVHAMGFYESFGFVARGPVFIEAAIEHRWMDRDLG